MRGYFITGTDTNIGKTVVAAGLTLALDACYWKPIQAGSEPSTDRADVARFTGLADDRLPPEAYRLRLPASPHWAAAAEGVTITLDQFQLPSTRGRALIVEGAGGIMVPLSDRELMRDLMVHLGLPVILVAGTQLGTINHTLLSLAGLRGAGLDIAGVILNGEPAPPLTATLEHFGGVAVFGTLPRLAQVAPAALRAAFAAHIHLPDGAGA